jgi:hypothetical protein
MKHHGMHRSGMPPDKPLARTVFGIPEPNVSFTIAAGHQGSILAEGDRGDRPLLSLESA